MHFAAEQRDHLAVFHCDPGEVCASARRPAVSPVACGVNGVAGRRSGDVHVGVAPAVLGIAMHDDTGRIAR
jgi:hypothetical protein